MARRCDGITATWTASRQPAQVNAAHFTRNQEAAGDIGTAKKVAQAVKICTN
jgi:hypothetical protein